MTRIAPAGWRWRAICGIGRPMKICRYEDAPDSPVKIGLVENDMIRDVSAVADRLPAVRWPFPPGDHFFNHLEEMKPAMQALAATATPIPVASVKLKSPIANPGKFVCGAGNHKVVLAAGHHPRNLGFLFKMTSASAGAGDGVELRWTDRITFYEGELAIIIGKPGTLIPRAEALSYVAGYAIGLDMTMQGKEFPSFGKSFDSYGIIGPWMTTADEIPDPSTLAFTLSVNGAIKQQGTWGDLALDVAGLIEHAASIMTLHPGDVIFTGTPPMSIGPVVPGDVMHATLDQVGAMTVEVRAGAPGTQPVYTD